MIEQTEEFWRGQLQEQSEQVNAWRAANPGKIATWADVYGSPDPEGTIQRVKAFIAAKPESTLSMSERRRRAVTSIREQEGIPAPRRQERRAKVQSEQPPAVEHLLFEWQCSRCGRRSWSEIVQPCSVCGAASNPTGRKQVSA